MTLGEVKEERKRSEEEVRVRTYNGGPFEEADAQLIYENIGQCDL